MHYIMRKKLQCAAHALKATSPRQKQSHATRCPASHRRQLSFDKRLHGRVARKTHQPTSTQLLHMRKFSEWTAYHASGAPVLPKAFGARCACCQGFSVGTLAVNFCAAVCSS